MYPGETTYHPIGRPELTATCSERARRDCAGSMLQQALEPGTPDWAESGPSQIGLAWPLRQRPLLAEAGCVGPFGLRARLSERARTRPGRIKSSFRWTAPFETELPHLRFTRSPTRKARATMTPPFRGRPRFACRAPSRLPARSRRPGREIARGLSSPRRARRECRSRRYRHRASPRCRP